MGKYMRRVALAVAWFCIVLGVFVTFGAMSPEGFSGDPMLLIDNFENMGSSRMIGIVLTIGGILAAYGAYRQIHPLCMVCRELLDSDMKCPECGRCHEWKRG